MGYSALRDLIMAGVKWELSDTPLVRSGVTTKQIAPQAQTTTNNGDNVRTSTCVVPPIAPVSPMSVETANAMAVRPNDIYALNRMIAEFNHPLRSVATNVVSMHIAQNPNGLVIVTDIPSADDDACGQILTGANGELMDKMLAAINMSRDCVSIIPMLFWRTPGGRTPSEQELELARPFFNRALELLKPRAILTLGTMPAAALANINLGRSHGVPVTLESGTVVMPIFHPNYLILKPAAKRDVWNALQNIENILKSA